MEDKREEIPKKAIEIIQNVFEVNDYDITDIVTIKLGMTNHSFLFRCKGNKYIIRVPGEGTEQLIRRSEEEAVYCAIAGKGICDDVVYINAGDGYKITRFIENVRVCNPLQQQDVRSCIKKLKEFHNMKLWVEHEFDLYGQIGYYEQLRQNSSRYSDYERTKNNVWELRPFIEKMIVQKSLAHIDAVPDNFLFAPPNEKIRLQLIDWEYAGMQDPHIDIAMFCIYAGYGRKQIDDVIDWYFEEKRSYRSEKIKCYCYIAACGLLWSNWCEYKKKLGISFGNYARRQYQYAKEYSVIANRLIKELEGV